MSYSNSKEEADAFLAKPELQAIPAVAAGRVAQVYDPVTVSSVSPPTALSFDWDGGLPARGQTHRSAPTMQSSPLDNRIRAKFV